MRAFREARAWARSLGLKSLREWSDFKKGGDLPADVPAQPDKRYRRSGWASWGDWLGTDRVAHRLRQYRPFAEAREWARGLGLKRREQWWALGRAGKLPLDLPTAPEKVYRVQGWRGWGDWLGTNTTGRVRPAVFRPFEEARAWARALGLKRAREWRALCSTGGVPNDVPLSPEPVYRRKGWAGWGDWLGTGNTRGRGQQRRVYRPFEEARQWARDLRLGSQRDWFAFSKSGRLPADIPRTPQTVYLEKGWRGFRDWLGTENVPRKRSHTYRPFEQAREWARGLRLKSKWEWEALCARGEIPADVPRAPRIVYRDKGWAGWADWLRQKTKVEQKRRSHEYRPFEQAREWARSLRLKSAAEWRAFNQRGLRPADVPSNPNWVYCASGWASWSDWLGADTTIGKRVRQPRVYRSFEEARRWARASGITSSPKWEELARRGELPRDLPRDPDWTYRKAGWRGWGDWLGMAFDGVGVGNGY